MYLKKSLWFEKFQEGKEGASKSEQEQEGEEKETVTIEEELANHLNQQRLYREVTLSLRTGLRDASSAFSFLRLRGLHSILNFLRILSKSPHTIHLFLQTQSTPQLQVVPVLFQHSLKERGDDYNDDKVANLNHIFGLEPITITSPSTNDEIALALQVLEGCCLLHRQSTSLAHQHNAVPVLLNILSTRGVPVKVACLDALISIMLDSPPNQVDFKKCNGITGVANLLKDKQAEENLRLKCGEFMLLLMGHVNERDGAPLASINEDMKRLLGVRQASLIWAASQFGSTLEPDERLIALQIQAGRVLESLNLK